MQLREGDTLVENNIMGLIFELGAWVVKILSCSYIFQLHIKFALVHVDSFDRFM